MLTFREFLAEAATRDQNKAAAGRSYRMDAHPISDFNKNLVTYAHTKSWGASGSVGGTPLERFQQRLNNQSVGRYKTKGLFAGDKKLVAAYGAQTDSGSITTSSRKGVTDIHLPSKDRIKVAAKKATLSTFSTGSRFQTLPSGERFSRNPSRPLQQKQVNPLAYARNQGVKVHWDLD